MTKEKVKVLSFGRMVASTKVTGKMVSSMESVYLLQKTIWSKKENGNMEEKSGGLNRLMKNDYLCNKL